MENSKEKFKNKLSKTILMSGVVALLVGLKLVLSYLIPAFKTPGELVLSGALLLIYAVYLLKIRSELENQFAVDKT